MGFPVDSVKLLLDMIRGNTPFDLRSAMKAVLDLISYVSDVFITSEAAQSIQSPEDLEGILALALEQHETEAVSADELSTKGVVMNILISRAIKKAMEWLLAQLS